MQRKYKLVMIVIISLFLIGGASMAIIKGVDHLRIEKQKRQKAESIKESKKEVRDQAEARQKITLWVVQHYEGPEIKTIEVGKIYTHGILGSGGRSVSVIINAKKQNIIEGISVDEDDNPTDPGGSFDDNEYSYTGKTMKNKTLDSVKVIYWEGKQHDERYRSDSRYQ